MRDPRWGRASEDPHLSAACGAAFVRGLQGRTYMYLRQKPLFAFGHGLSYTTFE